MKVNYKIWFKETEFAMLLENTMEWYPKETGGILMGYWGNTKEVVVTKIIGPGPKAVHKRYSFEPDDTYHNEQIAKIYSASNRTESYLGDWHTHPGSSPYLSGTDLTTLNKIASHKKSRAPKALMMILGTYPFGLAAWLCDYKKYGRKFDSVIYDTKIEVF